MSQVDRIGVVVPAKNEQQLLPACLNALLLAARQVAVPVSIIVVLDACSDNSAMSVHRAAEHNRMAIAVESIVIHENNVGAARQTGMRTLLDRHGSDGLWLATTDADSAVPPSWLQGQLAAAARGARVIAGTVAVIDWLDRNQTVRNRATVDYATTSHHVHGANLSFAAGAYCAVGGFPAMAADEDVALVEAFMAAGEPIQWMRDNPVETSARRHARTPAGFAEYLNLLDCETSRSA